MLRVKSAKVYFFFGLGNVFLTICFGAGFIALRAILRFGALGNGFAAFLATGLGFATFAAGRRGGKGVAREGGLGEGMALACCTITVSLGI